MLLGEERLVFGKVMNLNASPHDDDEDFERRNVESSVKILKWVMDYCVCC